MDTLFFLKSLFIGFVIAAPVGPIGVLCARRTLLHGRRAGFFSGMGASTADAIYGFIAAFGLTFISDFLMEHQALAPAGWRGHPGVPGRQGLCHPFGKEGRTSPVSTALCGDVLFHLFPDPYQSYDHIFLCGGLCRLRAGGDEGKRPVIGDSLFSACSWGRRCGGSFWSRSSACTAGAFSPMNWSGSTA